MAPNFFSNVLEIRNIWNKSKTWFYYWYSSNCQKIKADLRSHNKKGGENKKWKYLIHLFKFKTKSQET